MNLRTLDTSTDDGPGAGLNRLDPPVFADSLGLRDGGPRVVGVMIASADGRTAVAGSSSGLGHPSDAALLRELRARADVVLVGAGTLVAERYADMLGDAQRTWRVARGLSPHPVVVTISRELDLADVPIAHEDARFVVYSERNADGPGDVRTLDNLSVESVIADLGAASVLCEGGPKLLYRLVAAGLLDALVLTIAPLVAGGASSALIAGDALPAPLPLELAAIARADDHLFLHYRRGAD